MARCADEYNGDRCKNQVEETCDACGNGFCWDHLLNVVEVTISASRVENRVMCRECVTQEFTRLDEENAELKQDVRRLRAQVTMLEQQMKRVR
jgi:hypothetical protein